MATDFFLVFSSRKSAVCYIDVPPWRSSTDAIPHGWLGSCWDYISHSAMQYCPDQTPAGAHLGMHMATDALGEM